MRQIVRNLCHTICPILTERRISSYHEIRGVSYVGIIEEIIIILWNKRKQSIVELAKRSGIERSTLYQYLKGKRPMQNRGHLDTIMSWLHLTPE